MLLCLHSIVGRLMTAYGTRVPEHRGKWRIFERYVRHARPAVSRADALTRVERHGITLDLDLSDYVDRWIYVTGYFERDDYMVVERSLRAKPGAVVFDVGAHIGFYTVSLARALAPGGAVHAFEPNRATFQRLRANVALNDCRNVVLNDVALGEAVDRRTLFTVRRANSGGTSLLAVVPADSRDVLSYEVALETLDTYCARHAVSRLDLIKLDCQGYEPRILQGGLDVLARLRPRLLMECDPALLAATGWTVDRFVDFLRDLGYEVLIARNGRLLSLPRPARLPQPVNLHCLPAGEPPVESAAVRPAYLDPRQDKEGA